MVKGHVRMEDMLRAICSMRLGLVSSDEPAPLHEAHKSFRTMPDNTELPCTITAAAA